MKLPTLRKKENKPVEENTPQEEVVQQNGQTVTQTTTDQPKTDTKQDSLNGEYDEKPTTDQLAEVCPKSSLKS